MRMDSWAFRTPRWGRVKVHDYTLICGAMLAKSKAVG